MHKRRDFQSMREAEARSTAISPFFGLYFLFLTSTLAKISVFRGVQKPAAAGATCIGPMVVFHVILFIHFILVSEVFL